MESWWHNSLEYISIDTQLLLLGISAASTLIPESMCIAILCLKVVGL